MNVKDLRQKIKDYINPSQSQNVINYAIVIKGEWGSGKTYFVRKFLRENFDNDILQIYISLYGISSIFELEKTIKAAFIPLVDNKFIKLVKEYGDEVLNLANVKMSDLEVKNCIQISKEMISFLWRIGIDASQLYKEKDAKKIVFVIDDVERCGLEINNIFGYFSNILASNYIIFNEDYTIKQNFNKNRVIFILNEEKINSNLDQYRETREKIIGMEYELSPEIEEVIKNYQYDINNNNQHITPEIINKTIKEVCDTVKFYNLRMVKYTQQYINSVLIELQKNDKKLEISYIESFVKYFTVVMIQKIKGNISDNKGISESLRTYYNYQNLWDSTQSKRDQSTNFQKKWIPLYELFYDIAFTGTFNTEKIQEDYENWKTSNIDKENFNYLCKNYIYMDEKSFNTLYSSFNDKFVKNEMLEMNELFDFYKLNYDLIDKKIISKSLNELDYDFNDYFRRNAAKLKYDRFQFDYDDYWTLEIDYSESHNGNRMPEIMSRMIKMSDAHYSPNHYFQKFVAAYKSKDFHKMLEYIECVNPDYEEYTLSLLAKIDDMDEYFNYLTKFDTKEQLEIFEAFKKRYKEIIHFNKEYNFNYLIDAFQEDKEPIKMLASLYNDSKFDNNMNPSNYMKKVIAQKYLDLLNLE